MLPPLLPLLVGVEGVLVGVIGVTAPAEEAVEGERPPAADPEPDVVLELVGGVPKLLVATDDVAPPPTCASAAAEPPALDVTAPVPTWAPLPPCWLNGSRAAVWGGTAAGVVDSDTLGPVDGDETGRPEGSGG